MIVVDASVMVEALVGLNPEDELLDALSGHLSAPHVLDLEVLSALCGLVLGGKLSASDADQARQEYFSFAIDRYEAAPLADRIWELRHQFTSYDASYLALAEALGVPLHTCDAKLEHGHNATVRITPRTP